VPFLFPEVADDRYANALIASTRALSRYPREEWDRHTVAEVMTRDLKDVSLPPDADALKALAKMQNAGASRLLVVDGDRLLGILSLKDLLRFLNLKLELEDGEGTPKEHAREIEEHDGHLPHLGRFWPRSKALK
jgi:signal-transduction protein with cAMP-binding, CBS, and nucleotidyltransferase domain